MQVNPPIVTELRSFFKAGATPSALIRFIADRHAGDPRLDWLVRAYFREAFHIPMLQIGAEQVREIAAGLGQPRLLASVLHRMVLTRPEWDRPTPDATWLDALTTADEAAGDPASVPELAGSWDRMDDEAKRYIARIIDTSRELAGRVSAIAALAEQLQQRVGNRITIKQSA